MRPPDRRAAGPCGRPFMMRGGWRRRTTVPAVVSGLIAGHHACLLPVAMQLSGAGQLGSCQYPSGSSSAASMS